MSRRLQQEWDESRRLVGEEGELGVAEEGAGEGRGAIRPWERSYDVIDKKLRDFEEFVQDCTADLLARPSNTLQVRGEVPGPGCIPPLPACPPSCQKTLREAITRGTVAAGGGQPACAASPSRGSGGTGRTRE
jgi:hypothetical protein